MKKIKTVLMIMLFFVAASQCFAATPSAKFYIDRAQTKVDRNDNKGAIIDANMAIKLTTIEEYKTMALFIRACAELNMGNNNTAAVRDFTTVISKVDDKQILRECYYSRGFAYNNLREWNKSIADEDRAIQIDSDFAPAYETRGDSKTQKGLAKVQLNDKKNAVEDFKTAYSDYSMAKQLYIKMNLPDECERLDIRMMICSEYIPKEQQEQQANTQPTPMPTCNVENSYAKIQADFDAQSNQL